ncbi:acyl carrier protein [Pseudomonas entomophila]|uniref:Acyl carrier protein n=2 Tax=Pseudomonas entomophila TaxID=312306 RepID=A0ABY9QQ56_9PSED|nr:acyl carrier protein [Pseudomonas entomophila]WMW06175.1 acyl carrier protein [Pseudomonas entomophila]CAK18141.1 putative acyl carrier protein [Pseudomonas entomophila L48]
MDKKTTIKHWLVAYIADLVGIDQAEVAQDVPFSTFGLDSAAVIGMTGDLSDWLSTEIDPTVVYEHPTIEALATHAWEASETAAA